MKYLSDYIQERQTRLFQAQGAFFAFSHDQFNERKQEGVTYVPLAGGMLCPKEHVDALMAGLEEIYQSGIQQDMEENGKEAIIRRELGNHECYYTGNYQEVIDILADYSITAAEIRAIYVQEAARQQSTY